MASQVKEPGVKNKDLLCAFLSCIPVLGFFGFLFMGKKANRKQLTAMGRVYGCLSLGAFACLLVSLLLRWLEWEFSGSFGIGNRTLDEMAGNIAVFSISTIFLVWIICCIHTLSQLGAYRQYLYIKIRSTPERNPLVYNCKWRKENLTWMRWSWIPVVGGASLIFAGKQLREKKILKYGIGILAAASVLALFVFSNWVYWFLHDAEGFGIFAAMVICLLWDLAIIMSFMVREDYLDERAKCWDRDVRQQPLLQDKKWCRENSRWKRWTYFPYVGGVAFIQAGGKSGIRKYSLLGAVLCILNAVMLIAQAYLGYEGNDEGRMMILALEAVLYIFGLFFGKQIQWETLKRRAAALKGYRSEIERELDMLERAQRRNTETRNFAEEEQAAPVTQITGTDGQSAEPHKTADDQEKIDINRCTQLELTQLPGISIGQAKTAMEYRMANNGFKSVDELVEVLQIKPHFAVQIFAMAAVTQEKVSVKKHTDGGAARRRIDL